MGIPFTYKDSHGTYYVRYVIPSRIRTHLPGIRRDLRKSLRTKERHQARLRSRRFVVEIDRLIGEFELQGCRAKEYYLSLITAIDPFGNEMKIEGKDLQEETQAYIELQTAWAQMSQEHKDAVQNADYLRTYPECQQGSQSVDEMIDVFIRDKKGGIDENSLTDLIGSLELFRKFVGDRPIKQLTRADVRNFRESVPMIPSRYYLNKGLAEMSFQELVDKTEIDGLKRMSDRTIGKKIEAVRMLLKWAHESADFLTEDLSGPLKRKYVATAKNSTGGTFIPFTDDHLNNLIGCYLFTGPLPTRLKTVSPYKFWLPLIGMYSGARLEEICQLHLQDIVENDGIHMLRISSVDDEGTGKKVNIKTASSHREVPIHSELIRIGLLDFVDELRDSKETRLFPDLSNENPKNRYGYAATKWFGDTLRKSIKYEKGQGYCYHSFRKLFIQRLQNVTDVPREVRKALVGHSIGGGDTHEIYEGRYSPEVLKQNIERLEYLGLDLSHVSWDDFKRRVAEWHAKRGR
ncbi:site-specific integrase [uncultured Amphritea sp.]|uniref:site-specific integrase n=1 Tax=uncultured Amphritea sp. TaxID=981605 RepID=UPI0026223D7A|nr:site-specific integrase [uncultured Amphritea sp.]